jgi:competence protein ComEC
MRGLAWKGQVRWAEELASSGPCQVILVPLDAAVEQAQGKASFRARLYGVDPLRGMGVSPGPSVGSAAASASGRLVEVTIHGRDAPEVKPGSPLGATGRFALAPRAMNPGEFDRREHLASERTFAEFECSRIEVCGGAEVPWLSRLYPFLSGAARTYAGRAIDSSLPQQDGAVLKGVLLGDRKGIPLDVSADFKRSGFYRFVTIAGFHVDVVFALCERSIRKATRKPSLSRIAAAVLTFIYAGLSGWTPGAVRAFTCAIMKTVAPAARRKYHVLAGISAAALVVAWTTPFPLVDAGFQLSFAGALGSYVGGRYGPETGLLRLAAPAGALRVAGIFAFLLPVTAARFQDVSLAGFLAGGLWAAAITFLIPASFFTVLLPGAGRIAGWLPYVVVRALRQVTSWIASVPVASVTVPAPAKAEMAAYYLLILIFAWQGEERLRERATRRMDTQAHAGDAGRARLSAALRPVGVLLCCLTLLVCAAFRVYLPWPEVTFLSVGQGDCALVRYGRAAILVDTGTSAAFEDKVLPYLRRLGLTRIDLCVLSHLHQDHSGGFPGLCRELRVSSVLTAEGTEGEIQALLGGLACAPAGSPLSPLPEVLEAGPGSAFRVGGLTAKAVCIASPAPPLEKENNQSLVLVLSGPCGFVLEFWGDAPSQAVSGSLLAYPGDLLEEGVVRVVKVPHHGSRDSLAPGFYERLSASFAVVSVGPNSYGHPSNEVIQAAASCNVRLFRTDGSGAVFARFILGRAWVKPFLDE